VVSRLPPRLRRLAHDLRQLGLATTAAVLLDGMARRLRLPVSATRYILFAQPVAPEPLLPAAHLHGYTVRPLQPGDPAFEYSGRPETEILARARAGAICLGAFRDGLPCGFIWYSLGPYAENVHRCTLTPSPSGCTALDLDIVIPPRFRGSRAFAAVWSAAHERLRQQGVTWTVGRVAATNLVSLRAHERLGARPIGSMAILSLPSMEVLIGGPSPGLHVTRAGRPSPVCVLAAPQMSA